MCATPCRSATSPNPVQPRFNLEPKERLSIWKYPVDGEEYIVSADPSEGLDGGDPACAQVIARSNFEQVAVWHGYMEPMDFGRALYLLACFYNEATLAVERKDPSGASVLDYLRGVGYPNIYRMQQFDYEIMQQTERVGWITSVHTRGLIIDCLRDVVKSNQIILNDPDTVAEMKTFVRDKKSGKLKAAPGSHDDRVMALAIGCYLHMILPRTGGVSYENTMEARLARMENDAGNNGHLKLGRGGY